ncbi:uncharacterized protein LOC123539497 isoform X1 [Mercenaria mercenaria]|uniref:uncharacterized protein LOC123539497 isoform X1 n=1 Tax=Mercenaria mercenaria TaxID=6596 RepID=UPI00234E57BA|nr:uncharacterized protein LOC123539497 isoform X1 [Mercenaria mercenaria]XP_045180075.2 uncharacterized protein LOC123539497 isoform X1 [Mercenaria mercenaria]XP_045180076.2 uncharacterized protein LOC123539497 isoform X1 [Mercenaria mercenaria]
MGKSKRKSKCSLRSYILSAMVIVAFLTILYEIAIFCTLDRISNVSYFGGLISVPEESLDNSQKITDGFDAEIVLHELAGFREGGLSVVGRNKVINTVHYVWCHNKTFDFRNYLSVMSVWKILRPDIIEFHQKVAPKPDKYDDWLVEIQKTIPSFVMKELPQDWDGDDMGCGFWFGLAVIDDRGGIYVGENVIITEEVVKYLESDMTLLFSKSKSSEYASVAFAMGTDHDEDFKTFRRAFAKNKEIPNKAHFCEIVDESLDITKTSCYVLSAPLSPADVFQSETQFGELVRKLTYGSTERKAAKAVLPGTIPKIVHYVWFGSKELDFMMFLSMLSTLFILNPEKVFIHTDGGLKGGYFDRILKDQRVVLVLREKPFNIYGHKVIYTQHRSDIVRAECLLRYGGIYMDWDVLWLKNPDDLIQAGYDAIANFDHIQQGNFPDTINLGVLMAKPKSTFIKRWQDALANYKSEDFLYNAVELPYKIYEKYPQYLKIEKRLQVMCFRLKCHPTFQNDFKNFMEEQPFDWRTDVYSIHFTFPDPPELTNEFACRNGTGRFAEIGQFILQHEKKLKT